MNKAEKILEKFARKNMIEWNQESFKRTHSQLHRSIIEAINEAMNLHNVAGRSEQFCECDGVQDLIAGTGECRKCGKECTY